eukprot:1149906-Pelagomonas_calceolata.AAC.7
MVPSKGSQVTAALHAPHGSTSWQVIIHPMAGLSAPYGRTPCTLPLRVRPGKKGLDAEGRGASRRPGAPA